MSDIKVRIYGEFNDRAWTKAQKKTSLLEKSFKSLGKTLLAVFTAQKLLAFSKDAVKAFADDEKAAAALAKTLDNLGLAFEDPRVRAFIAELEKVSGVSDDQLRPALQKLLTQTGSVTKSQELLTLALDISAGSGVDLTTVADDLAKAYVGNYKGLKKYALGLTDAELKAMSFSEIQAALLAQFSGQNAAYLDTYAGKLAVVDIAFQNLKETVGKELLDAFARLGGEDGIQGTAEAIGNLAEYLAIVIRGAGAGLEKLQKIADKINANPILKWLIEHGFGPFGPLYLEGKKDMAQPKPFEVPMTITGQSDYFAKQDKARAKAEADAAKRAKDLALLQKKNAAKAAADEKKNQQLKRAGTIFDMENIQIVAALQGRINEEQRLRLIALLAINNEIADAADKTTAAILALQAPMLNTLGIQIKATDNASTVVTKIVDAQTKLFLLNTGIANIPKAKNPFEDWNDVMKTILENLDKIAEKIVALPKVANTANAEQQKKFTAEELPKAVAAVSQFQSFLTRNEYGSTIAEYMATNGAVMGGNYNPGVVTAALGMGAVSRGEYSPYVSAAYPGGMGAFGRGEYGAPTVVVNVAGSVTAEKDLAEAIRESLYEFQKTGGDIRTNAIAI